MQTDEICHVKVTSFRDQLGDNNYPIEPQRYWLFTSKLCPFAHRTEIMRALKKLEPHIGHTATGSIQTEKGWDLTELYAGRNMANPVTEAGYLPQLYEMASPGYSGRASVPVLFDLNSGRIVNNESSEIIRQFDSGFDSGTDCYYPQPLQADIDQLCDFLADELIDPMYLAGFARDQSSYEHHFNQVFSALEQLDQRLSERSPYLFGEQLTVADIHAFAHLCRFDSVYYSLYRLNMRYLASYPNIADYMRALSELSAFRDTFDVEAVKTGYFLSWNQPTNGAFVPLGPPLDANSGLAQL